MARGSRLTLASRCVALQSFHTLFLNRRPIYQVGGLISLNFDQVSPESSVSLAFTESPMFISPLTSDDSSYPAPNSSYDGVLKVPAPLPTGFWTQPSAMLRGGYRYLTIVSNSDDPVTISNVSCAISFSPHIENLRDYSGYFYASDPVSHDKNFLTKVPPLFFLNRNIATNA